MNATSSTGQQPSDQQNNGGQIRPAYDVVVVGGGAAGLSAALTLSRARRSVLVVDAGAPRNAPAGRIHNYLGPEGTTASRPAGARAAGGHRLRRAGHQRQRDLRCGPGRAGT